MSVATASGTAQCEVSRYDEHEELPVRAYEWCTELRIGPQASEPDAIACGMVYVFERDEDGIPYGRLSDLMDAADSVADTDVLQVSAFLQQHGDAADLLTYSDVCFVWLWERRVGTPKGIGGDCLKAAVSNLKKRFGKMRLVVVDVKPTQFISWTDETDLPQIGVAKQEAIEAVMDRLDQLSVDDCIRGEVRPIINNRGGDPEAAMAALMMARFS